jgi:hypothetical protein
MQASRLYSSERIFTLAEWQHMTKVVVTLHTSGAYTVPDYSWLTGQWRWELFHLKDYVVTSVTAGTIWLVERQQMEVDN